MSSTEEHLHQLAAELGVDPAAIRCFAAWFEKEAARDGLDLDELHDSETCEVYLADWVAAMKKARERWHGRRGELARTVLALIEEQSDRAGENANDTTGKAGFRLTDGEQSRIRTAIREVGNTTVRLQGNRTIAVVTKSADHHGRCLVQFIDQTNPPQPVCFWQRQDRVCVTEGMAARIIEDHFNSKERRHA